MSDEMHMLDEFTIDPALAPERMPIRISDAMARVIDTAEEREVPMVFAYIDEKNAIRQTFRGSIHVHGARQLAFWNRDPAGGFIRALEAGNNAVCTTYREPGTPRTLQFHGRAHVVQDPAEAERVWRESPELERTLTHGRNGVAVIIELDRVQGVDQRSESGAWEPFLMTRA